MSTIKKIAVHAGHAPADSKAHGAVGYLDESTVNREVAHLIVEKLDLMGYDVKDCTCNNCDFSSRDVLVEIAKKTNDFNPDLSISIHANAFNNEARGVETWIYNDKTITKDLAKNVTGNIASLGFQNRGIKFSDSLFVLRKIYAPSMLVEMFFCDNKDDCALYDCENIANAIILGVTGEVAPDVSTNTRLYRVQVGAFKSYDNAIRLKNELEGRGYQCFVTD